MNAAELFEAVQKHPELLFVRMFFEQSGSNPRTKCLLLWCEKRVVYSLGHDGNFDDALTYFGASPSMGIWSDQAFTRRHLYPRLERHPAWLCPDPIVVVVKSRRGSEMDSDRPGRMALIYLSLMLAGITRGTPPSERIKAILRKTINGFTPADLLQ